MIDFLKLQTLVFDPAKYEKLSRAQSTYEVDGATDELSGSFEFSHILLSKSDCCAVVRIEGSFPLKLDKETYQLSTIHLEKSNGVIVSMENFLGTPETISEKINNQLKEWQEKFEAEFQEIDTAWSDETFRHFIEEVMTYPKKEREKLLKGLDLKSVITLEFLEELKVKQLLIQEK